MTTENYDITYQLTHDIDWFGIQNGIPFHVASNGDLIPQRIIKNVNQKIQAYTAGLHYKLNDEDIVINEGWLRELEERYSSSFSSPNILELQHRFDRRAYLRSFVNFARKGFLSIDNSLIRETYTYKIVAYPKNYSDRFCCPEAFELPDVSIEELKNLNVDVWRTK